MIRRAQPLQLNATAETCQRLTKSYGAITTISSYLTQFEILQFQQLSQYFYRTAVSRVQTRITLRSQRVLMTRYGTSPLKSDVIEVSYGRQEMAHYSKLELQR